MVNCDAWVVPGPLGQLKPGDACCNTNLPPLTVKGTVVLVSIINYTVLQQYPKVTHSAYTAYCTYQTTVTKMRSPALLVRTLAHSAAHCVY